MNVRENRRGKKETGNTGYSKTQNEEKQNKTHNTICVGRHSTHRNTNNVNKT